MIFDAIINILSILFCSTILYLIYNDFYHFDRISQVNRTVFQNTQILVVFNNFRYRKIIHHAAAVVYNTCHNDWPTRGDNFKIPSYRVSCSNKTHNVDCYEAIPYLRFIYQNYDNITGKIFFIHGHERSWHYHGSVFNAINRKMQMEDFDSLAYEGLYRTLWHNYVPWKVKDENGKIYDELFKQIYKGTSMMKYYDVKVISFPCCGTFVVDAETGFKRRPREEYMTFIERLTNYSLHVPNAAYYCGRLLEYTWHLMLSDNPIVIKQNVV